MMQLRFILMFMVVVQLVGCAKAYRLKGKVLESENPRLEIVKEDDPRLSQMGVGRYVMNLKIDPDRIEEHPLGIVESDRSGGFDIEVDYIGAGFLLYELGVDGRKRGFSPILEKTDLPKYGQALIVYVKRGVDFDIERDDPIGNTLKMIPAHERPRVGDR